MSHICHTNIRAFLYPSYLYEIMTGKNKRMNYPFRKVLRLNELLLKEWDPVFLRQCLQYKEIIKKNLEKWMDDLFKKSGL